MMENSRFLIFTFDFERAERETNTKLRCSLLFASSLLAYLPLPFGSGCLVLYIPLLISAHCLCSRTTAQLVYTTELLRNFQPLGFVMRNIKWLLHFLMRCRLVAPGEISNLIIVVVTSVSRKMRIALLGT